MGTCQKNRINVFSLCQKGINIFFYKIVGPGTLMFIVFN